MCGVHFLVLLLLLKPKLLRKKRNTDKLLFLRTRNPIQHACKQLVHLFSMSLLPIYLQNSDSLRWISVLLCGGATKVKFPGRRITVAGAETSQQCRKCFLPEHVCGGVKLRLLPQAPSNLAASMSAVLFLFDGRIEIKLDKRHCFGYLLEPIQLKVTCFKTKLCYYFFAAFNRRNHPRLGGALSVPPPGQHQNGTNVLKEIYHMPWPGKPKEYQTNVTRCPGIQQNEPNTVQKDLSVSPNKTKLSLEKQTPKIPHLTDNTSHKQAIFSPISHSSQHSKNTPSPYYTSKKNQQVTSTPDYYFRDVSCVTSQAWSGGLPASTTLTAFPTSLSRHVRSTGSTNTENLRESSGVGKLLVKRAQVTRNLLQTVPVRGDNYVLHKFPDHSLNMIKSGRAVLRMRNKR